MSFSELDVARMKHLHVHDGNTFQSWQCRGDATCIR